MALAGGHAQLNVCNSRAIQMQMRSPDRTCK